MPRPGIGEGRHPVTCGMRTISAPIMAVMRTFSGQVVVVADQDAELRAQQIEDGVAIAAGEKLADERVQLAMLGDEAVAV